MAFKNRELSVIAYANGWTMWHYKTEDDIKIIDEDNKYFIPQVVRLMACGDVIFITSKGITYQRQIVDISNDVATIGTVN